MKRILILTLVFSGLFSWAQQRHLSILNTPNKAPIIYQTKSIQTSAVVDSADIIWYEDFREGLDGNNSSTNPAWSTQGSDNDVWEYDTDGSNGDYSSDFTIESESAANGWMIFDADKSNAGIPVSSYSERRGQLTSPYIDLTNDSNVTLSFEHAYRWCCSNNHELIVSINDGTGWENSTNFQVNELGNVNDASGTVKVDIIITEIAALKDSVQIRFDWANNQQTASHYFWMIDDVKISKTQAYSSNLLTSNKVCVSDYFGITSYRVMPLEQVSSTAYFFGGIVENIGYNTLDSLRIIAEIESEDYTSQSIGTSLISSERDTLFVNTGFTPTTVGNFTSTILAKDDDNNVLTDTLNQSFEITEYVYARDNGNNVTNFGRYPLNADGTRQYGNVFDIYTSTSLYGITLRLDERTTPNAEGTVRINTVDPFSGDISFLTESQTLSLGSITEEWFNVTFNPPIMLDAGQIVLATLYSSYNNTDTVYISTSGTNPYNGESLVQDIDGIQDGVSPGTWLYSTTSPCIRLNFDPQLEGINAINEQIKSYPLNIYPNPNNGNFNIQIFSKENNALTLKVCNLIGQEVFVEELTFTNSYSKNLNLSHLDKGIYTVSISENDTTVNVKMITIQ